MTHHLHRIVTVIAAALLASTITLVAPGRVRAHTCEPDASRVGHQAEANTRTAGNALGLPGWLRVGIDHQARFEHLANDFRAGAEENATALSLSTLLVVEATRGPVIDRGLGAQQAGDGPGRHLQQPGQGAGRQALGLAIQLTLIALVVLNVVRVVGARQDR